MSRRRLGVRRAMSLTVLPVLWIAAGCQAPNAAAARVQPIVFTDRADTVYVRAVPLREGAVADGHDAPRASAFHTFMFGPEEQVPAFVRAPQGLTAHADRLYICDPVLPDVVAFDPRTGAARHWTKPRDRPVCPVDITFDDAGIAYVADPTRGAVLVYDAAGGQRGALAPDVAQGMFQPCAVLVHGGVLYAADRHRRRVERYSIAQQSWLDPVTPASQPFGAPVGLAVAADGTLLIADALLGVVHRIDSNGTPRDPIGTRGRGPGQLVRPMHVAAAGGFVFVTDAARQSVLVYRESGAFVLEVTASSDAAAPFTLPLGIAAWNAPDETASATSNDAGMSTPDVRIVVTDSLGGVPLTLLTLSRNPAAPTSDRTSATSVTTTEESNAR